MNLTQNRVRSIGWAVTLTMCLAATLGLTFKVNSVKSRVRLAERQIVAIEREKLFLETEFETRANQQQLKNLNDVEFGYQAPTSGQYLENERELAALGKPRGPGAPSPIRVASATDVAESSIFPAMVSPLSGKAMAAEMPREGLRKPVDAAGLQDRLTQIPERDDAAGEQDGAE